MYDRAATFHQYYFNLYSEYMMKDAVKEEAEGLTVNGRTANNLRYADDAVFLSDERIQLQRMMDKVVIVCNEYNMEINVKKMKVIAFSEK